MSARDEICNLIAAYAQALDDGRSAEVVATFADGGTFEIVGTSTHTGAAELRAAYDSWAPQVPQRHVVTNTYVHESSATTARATSDFAFMVNGGKGWVTSAVGRYDDELVAVGGEWKFRHRRATFVS
jgi:hypothetical protein